MSIFSKKKTKETENKTEEKTPEIKPARNASQIEAGGPAEKTEKKPEKKPEKKEAVEIKPGAVKEDIILEPWITEKSHDAMAVNKYIFKVVPDANKKNIKSAIESLYNVKVVDVNIINIPAKKRMYGRHTGMKSGFKKAVVKLKEGDKIELFKGV